MHVVRILADPESAGCIQTQCRAGGRRVPVGQEAEGYLCDGAANSSPAGLRNLVSLQRAYHTIRGEEEHTVVVQALYDLIHAVVTLQLGAPHACNPHPPSHPLEGMLVYWDVLLHLCVYLFV